MTKINKNCCVRLPEELHRETKLRAYENGLSLQAWIIDAIEKHLAWHNHSKKMERPSIVHTQEGKKL